MDSGFWPIIGGVVIGAVITALATPVHGLLFGPRLSVLFHAGEFGKVKTTEHHRNTARLASMGDPSGGPGQEINSTLSYFIRDVVYVRLRVSNSWHGTLNNCRGFLVDIERELEDGKRDRVFFDSVPLSWSYVIDPKNGPSIDIPRGVIFNLDVLATRKGEESYEPRMAAVPTCYSQLFKAQGTFRWTIVVTADNAGPKVYKLRLRWRGEWDDFDVEEIPDRDW